MSIFVDTSVWFAAAAKGDRNNELAKSILQSVPDHVTTDHVLIETWVLLKSKFGRGPAETFWERIRSSSVHIEPVTPVDLEAAWTIGSSFPKQDFSLIDRTSFAVMERTGITKAATFDADFQGGGERVVANKQSIPHRRPHPRMIRACQSSPPILRALIQNS